ncbi:MAG: FixH family protein [Myxococcota bacterium]
MIQLILLFVLTTGCSDKNDSETGNHHHHHHHGGDDTAIEDGNFTTEATTEGSTWTLQYESVPSPIVLSENFSLNIDVINSEGPATDATLTFDATMPAHDHGMNTEASVSSNGDGSFAVTGMQFHMTGHWRLHATVSAEGQSEEYAWFDVICCD